MAKKAPPQKTTSKPKAKATPKKVTAKKPTAKAKAKPQTTAKPKTKAAQMKSLISSFGARRPPNNPNVPKTFIEMLTHDMGAIKEMLESFAAHLRSLDRKRLNGVGIKKQGFIERAYEFAQENPEFLPHYLTLAKFKEDGEYFLSFRMLVDLTDQIRELLWNITIESSDVWYTDALEFYSSVKEAAKRRVDPAETIYNALEVFFRKSKRLGEDGKPLLTKKKLERDERAVASGKKDGRIVIENVRPKMTGGVHKVIDETFSDSEQYKETAEGEIKE
jgi:hypothetical protein